MAFAVFMNKRPYISLLILGAGFLIGFSFGTNYSPPPTLANHRQRNPGPLPKVHGNAQAPMVPLQHLPHPSKRPLPPEQTENSASSSPPIPQGLRDAQQAVSEALRVKREALDSPFLVNLGLDPLQITHVLSNRAVMYGLAVKAGDRAMELSGFRNTYTSELRSMLGEDGYAKYKDYELQKPARRIMAAAIGEQALSQASDEEKAEILTLIRRLNPPTPQTWDGPFDILPRPLAGSEQLIPFYQTELHQLRSALQSLPAEFQKQRLPSVYLESLNGYFENMIKSHENTIERLKVPESVLLEEAMKRDRLRREADSQK